MSEDAARAYARELARRLEEVLGGELLGVYLIGSLALGGYEPGRSDVDVAAVVERPLPIGVKEAVVAASRHEELPCPARKLELVVYARDRAPAFELNLDTGEGEHHVSFHPAEESPHWFTIDVAIARASGVALLGPPPAALFPAVPVAALRAALRQSLEWSLANEAPPDDVVLNACRSRRLLDEGVWMSKAAAGEWALERLRAGHVVAAAVALHRGEPGAELPLETARAFAREYALPDG